MGFRASIAARRHLCELGLTDLESEAYAQLVADSPATGYRVAQAIRKPVANTYKALEGLSHKGAVDVDDGGATKLFRAVPPDEFLGRLDREFTARRKRAADALGQLTGGGQDDRVYCLESPEQVLERARTMLDRCRETLLLDIFPEPLGLIQGDIERAAGRGVQVTLKTYAPVTVRGAEVIFDSKQAALWLSSWPGQFVHLVVDAREFLLASLTTDLSAVYQALWSRSPLLTCESHVSLRCELEITTLWQQLERGDSADQLRSTVERFDRFSLRYAAGFREFSAAGPRAPHAPAASSAMRRKLAKTGDADARRRS